MIFIDFWTGQGVALNDAYSNTQKLLNFCGGPIEDLEVKAHMFIELAIPNLISAKHTKGR